MVRVVLAIGLAILATTSPARSQTKPIDVLGAASLRGALEAVNAAFAVAAGAEVIARYSDGVTLLKDIEGGGFDVLVSDALRSDIDKSVAKNQTRFDLAGDWPIVYSVVAPQPSRSATARYLAFLRGSTAQVIFERHGFIYLVKAGP